MVIASNWKAVEELNLQYTDSIDCTELHGFPFDLVDLWSRHLYRFGTGQKPIFQGKHSELSDKIIKVFYEVYNELEYGFSEKIYQKAFGIALRQIGLKVEEQLPVKAYFRRQEIGEYFADMIVNDLILIELEAAGQIVDVHEAQLRNCLKPTKIEMG